VLAARLMMMIMMMIIYNAYSVEKSRIKGALAVACAWWAETDCVIEG